MRNNLVLLLFVLLLAGTLWRCGDPPPSQEPSSEAISSHETVKEASSSENARKPQDNEQVFSESPNDSTTTETLREVSAEPPQKNDAGEHSAEKGKPELASESPVLPEKDPSPEKNVNEQTNTERLPPETLAEVSPEPTPEAPPVGSTGCGKNPPMTGVNENMTMTVMGKQRNYVLSVPTTYDKNTLHPVIFGFPGLNATGKQARGYLGLEKTAGPPIIYVYPTAQVVSSGWKMQVGGGDIEFFDALLTKLEKDYCINPKRVYSTGFSHGAMFTNNLTCVRIQKLRAVAPIGGSGPWYNNCKNGPLAAMVIHGDNDKTVKFTDGEKTRDHWKTQNACNNTTKATTPSPCVIYQQCKQPTIWCPFAGGHQVPSFAGVGIRDFFLSFK